MERRRKRTKLGWHQVLNSHSPYAPWFGHINLFFEKVVVPSGYRYFEWNGLVYERLKWPDTWRCLEERCPRIPFKETPSYG